MLIQTKRAIESLKAAGLKRSEFRVRTERIMRGSTFVGYGDALIVLLCPISRQQELASELAKRFRVIQYYLNDGATFIRVEESVHPCLIGEKV